MHTGYSDNKSFYFIIEKPPAEKTHSVTVS